jgi:hypothetical protein
MWKSGTVLGVVPAKMRSCQPSGNQLHGKEIAIENGPSIDGLLVFTYQNMAIFHS